MLPWRCIWIGPDPLNPPTIITVYDTSNTIKITPNEGDFIFTPNIVGGSITKEEFFKTKCDFVIPAALELQITKETAENLDCMAVIEAANGPVTEEADVLLEQKNIDIIPDVLCNSGCVVVS